MFCYICSTNRTPRVGSIIVTLFLLSGLGTLLFYSFTGSKIVECSYNRDLNHGNHHITDL